MNNLNIIDQFMQAFARYLDSGFGLLNGDVVGLSSILIGIDVTLAALWWAVDRDGDILIRLIRKVLYVGAFAYILNNYATLSTLIFNSFSKLGLDATGAGLSASDLMQPGKLAGTGFTAAWPLLQQAGSLLGVTSFFTNFVTIAVLLVAWFLVIIAFFILAIQLFITVLEYKLTCLAGFTLVPFAFWNKTSFLAERVLGNVISSGVKVMVLAIIVGIGSTLFSTFTSAAQGQQPTIASAMSLVLAALTFLGLGIFGPSIATGLVAGAPQLGAGAAIGTVGAVASGALLAGGAVAAGVGALGAAGGGLSAIRAGASMGPGGASAAGSGSPSSGGGPAGGAPGGGAAAGPPPGPRAGSSSAPPEGGASPTSAPGDASAASAGDSAQETPAWAKRFQSEQRARDLRRHTAEAVKQGDSPGAPANPELDQED